MVVPGPGGPAGRRDYWFCSVAPTGAAGPGADAVVVCDAVTDVHNPNVVRASVGTLFTVPVYTASSQEALQWLDERGIGRSPGQAHERDRC